MATLRDEIQSLLKTGYTLEGNRVLDPNGKVVRDKDTHQPINVKHAEGYHYRRRLLGQLNAARVLRPQQRQRATSPHEVKQQPEREKKNPLLLAAEILRDPMSSPRERGMARAYNELFQTHTRVRALAQALGKELQERGE